MSFVSSNKKSASVPITSVTKTFVLNTLKAWKRRLAKGGDGTLAMEIEKASQALELHSAEAAMPLKGWAEKIRRGQSTQLAAEVQDYLDWWEKQPTVG